MFSVSYRNVSIRHLSFVITTKPAGKHVSCIATKVFFFFFSIFFPSPSPCSFFSFNAFFFPQYSFSVLSFGGGLVVKASVAFLLFFLMFALPRPMIFRVESSVFPVACLPGTTRKKDAVLGVPGGWRSEEKEHEVRVRKKRYHTVIRIFTFKFILPCIFFFVPPLLLYSPLLSRFFISFLSKLEVGREVSIHWSKVM